MKIKFEIDEPAVEGEIDVEKSPLKLRGVWVEGGFKNKFKVKSTKTVKEIIKDLFR